MAALDLTSFDAALKQHYTDERIYNMVYEDNPFLGLVPKMENFGGRNLPIPIIFGVPSGRSATFATAVANKNPGKYEDFVLTRVRDYSLADIDNETMEASRGNANAFLEAAATEIDLAIHSIERSLAPALYGSGSGSIGVVGSGITTVTITLATIEDVVNFEVGHELVVSAADGGGAVRAGSVTLTAIDRVLGTLTSDSAWDAQIGAIAVNDFIFVEGDYDLKASGLRAWLPDSAPSATLFFGVDRTQDSARLGGLRYDGTAQSIDQALTSAANLLGREGGRASHVFMSFERYAELENALGDKKRYGYMNAKGYKGEMAKIGYNTIVVAGPKGDINIIPDHNCPTARAFMLDMRVWKLYSLNGAPHIIRQDGLRMLRNSGSDSAEVRIGYYLQLGCRAPGFNVNIQLV